MGDWNPASLLINRDAARALASKSVYWGERFTGKTETLLAFVALTCEDPIIVTKTVDLAKRLRRIWKERYPKLLEPRFLSWQQFVYRGDGLSGTVFTDECPLDYEMERRFHPYYLRFGGGVCS